MKFSMNAKAQLCPNGGSLKSISGFTLAEMMVVMLILSIVMAAFAPVMTTRSKVDLSSPWQWASNNSDIFYGMGNNQTAMIGQRQVSDTDPQSRLVINAPAGSHHILFKKDGTMLGQLNLEDTNLTLGNGSINGARNTVIGRDAYVSGTNSSSDNVAIGHESLQENTSGANNTAVGQSSLESNTSGGFNTAIGSGTLQNSSTATHNTAVGAYALQANTTGNSNAAIGADSLFNNTTGEKNIAIGHRALYSNQTGNNIIAIGYNAMETADRTFNSIAIGNEALSQLSTSSANIPPRENIAIGHRALYENKGGDGNIAIGNNALASNVYANGNIAIGSNALANNSGYGNIALGGAALESNKNGNNNIAIGVGIMSAQENGSNNVAIGSFEFGSQGSVPKSGNNNVVIGHDIIPTAYNGSNIVAIGYGVDYRSGGGKNGIVIGAESEITYGDSGYTSSSVAPIAIGYKAKSRNAGIAIGEEATIEYGYVAERPSSIAIGKSASATNGGISIGYEASALGSNSIAIGNNACKNVEGRNKICIGANSGPQFGSFNGESYMGEDDYGERIFIGSKSHYNDGNAVLEVHNLDTNDTKIKIPAHNDSAVVVNGSLIVYGTIYNTVRRVSSNEARIWGALEYHSSNHNAHWNMEVNDKGNYH